MDTRKIKVVGFPGRDGIEYVALDAVTGKYLEGQIDVVIQTNFETGAKNAQIVINCSDIIMMEKEEQ
jgi:hypothetical protein